MERFASLITEYLDEHTALHEVSPKFLKAKRSCIRRGLQVLAEQGATLEGVTTGQVVATLGAI